MADDAGFAVALTIREGLINDSLLQAYASDPALRALSLDVPGAPPDVVIDAFLAPFRITCQDDDSLRLDLRFWGQLAMQTDAGFQVRTVDARLSVRIEPRFVVQGTNLVLSPATDDVTVAQWSYTVIAGLGFPSDVDLYLRGGLFQDRLRAAVLLALGSGLIPPIDLSFLEPVIAFVDPAAAARVRAGVLLVGLSAHADGLTLVGDPDLLYDFARGNDIAAATNASAVPLVLASLATMAADEVAQQGATLIPPLSLTADAGHFHVAGAVGNSDGTAHFSFDLVPSMFHTRPGAQFNYLKKPVHVNPRTFPALSFSPANVHVDLSTATWIRIVEAALGVVTVGLAVLAIEDMLQSLANQLRTGIETADTGPVVSRVRRSAPDANGVVVRLEITEYAIATTGTYMGLTVRLEQPRVALEGPATIPADLRAEPLRYRIRLPLDVHDEDPQLRIRWTVFDNVAGHVLVNEDNLAAGRTAFEFTPDALGPGLTSLGIACRVYRTLGPEITDLVNEGLNLTIRGPLQPGAYRRWQYDVKNPQVVFDVDNERFGYAGDRVVSRHSNLHRTEQPCRNAARISRYNTSVELLDALPFPVRDLAAHRAELCDYCFFGGPTGVHAMV